MAITQTHRGVNPAQAGVVFGQPCEVITAEQLAERWHVTVRWVMDQTRASVDPLPHFKRGRVKLFQWWGDCPDSPLQKWWDRHTVARTM